MDVLNIPDGLGGWMGIPLIQGKSAYQSALDSIPPYTGTEAEFNLSLATVNEVYIGSTQPTQLEEIWIDPTQSGNTIVQTTGNDTNLIMSQYAVTNAITGLTTTVTNNFNQRDMLSTTQSVISTTGATVSPDFTDGIYKCTTNYAGGTAISISTFTNIPTFDTCKTVIIKNIKGSDITAALATTQTVGSVVYTFINMKDNTNAAVSIPTTKTLEISYLFAYQSSTTCNVEVVYLIQN
jgi:hypothetical protein